MKLLSQVLVSVFLVSSLSFTANAQFPEVHIAGGFTTHSFIGDQIAANPLVAHDSLSLPGASFNGQQLGATIKAIVYLDSDKKFRMPIGVDYVRYFGAQRIEVSKFYRIQLFNSLHTITPTLGLDYALLKLPLANANLYTGVELRGTFITNTQLAQEDYFNYYKTVNGFELFDRDSLFKVSEIANKPNTFRLGGVVKLGVEGKIQDPVYLNISLSYGSPNLFGRDNNRAELFTPNNTFETMESVVSQLFFHFLLQYRL